MFARLRLPRITNLRQDDTHRLIASRYAEEGVLTPLAEDGDDLDALYELEGATNGRLVAEAGRAPGISVHELVFGIPNANIINAAFCYPNPQGSRFSSHLRGAWYAAFTQETSIKEIEHHMGKWLSEVHWKESDWESPQVFPYVDFLADFRGGFHDIRRTRSFSDCLLKADYVPSQALAASLLANSSSGIVYPSVRHRTGTCLACFRPALVTNVRRSVEIRFTYSDPLSSPEVAAG